MHDKRIMPKTSESMSTPGRQVDVCVCVCAGVRACIPASPVTFHASCCSGSQELENAKTHDDTWTEKSLFGTSSRQKWAVLGIAQLRLEGPLECGTTADGSRGTA